MALADLNGEDITRILNTTGPIVTCVLVRGGSGEDAISEVRLDTTPQKREVENLLGGPITFLGQYPEEGVVVMTTKKDLNNTEQQASSECVEGNRVRLPMPLDEVVVYSDCLIMKVTKDDDDDFFLDYSKELYLDLVSRGGEKRQEPLEEDSDSEVDDDNELEQSDDEECSNEEDADSDGQVLDDDDDYDENFSDDGEDMELDSEEERIGMLNLCMGQILRRFQEENGHGPDTRQLLEMRHALAIKLGVEVSLPPEHSETEDVEEDIGEESNDNDNPQTKEDKVEDIQSDENVRKSVAQDEDNTPRKRVKFSSYVDEQEIEMVSIEEHDMATEADEQDMATIDDEPEISSST